MMYYFVSPNGTKYKTDKLKQFQKKRKLLIMVQRNVYAVSKNILHGWTVSQNVKEDQAEDKVDIRNIRAME